MDVLKIYLRSITAKYLSREEEHDLAVKAKGGDQQARARLIESMLPLAVKLSKKYRDQGVDYEDLIQAANLIVIKAVDSFKPELNLRLITYLYRGIGQTCAQVVRSQACVIYRPANWNTGKFSDEARSIAGRVGSIDAREYVFLAHKQGEPPHNDELEQMRQAVERLPERWRVIIEGRLEGRTLDDLGRELGVSKERVRQLEEQAHGYLRRLMSEHHHLLECAA